MEWLSFKQIRDKYPEIERWIKYNIEGKFPQKQVVNTVKSINNINEHWNDKQIVEKPIESWDDVYHPKFKVVEI
ncbi:MAG: hypothetical protein II937_09630 [Bacteroidales bacterium]|nr:hypothetical protein [Bacteroidales bacterium]